jgi:hypothetical protein
MFKADGNASCSRKNIVDNKKAIFVSEIAKPIKFMRNKSCLQPKKTKSAPGRLPSQIRGVLLAANGHTNQPKQQPAFPIPLSYPAHGNSIVALSFCVSWLPPCFMRETFAWDFSESMIRSMS